MKLIPGMIIENTLETFLLTFYRSSNRKDTLLIIMREIFLTTKMHRNTSIIYIYIDNNKHDQYIYSYI